MSEFDILESTEEPEESPPVEDTQTLRELAGKYHAARPGTQREELWESFSDEEREQLHSLGITGPMLIADDEEFEHVAPDHPNFVSVDRRARQVLRAGLNRVANGSLDVSQEVRGRLSALARDAERLPAKSGGSRAAQEGARIIEELDARARPGFDAGQVQKKRTYYDHIEGVYKVEQTDAHGNQRVSILSEDDHPEQYTAPVEELPKSASLEQFLSWSPDKRVRFAKKRPDAYKVLLRMVEDPTAAGINEKIQQQLKDVVT